MIAAKGDTKLNYGLWWVIHTYFLAKDRVQVDWIVRSLDHDQDAARPPVRHTFLKKADGESLQTRARSLIELGADGCSESSGAKVEAKVTRFKWTRRMCHCKYCEGSSWQHAAIARVISSMLRTQNSRIAAVQ